MVEAADSSCEKQAQATENKQLINFRQECQKQNKQMGNQTPAGIPPLLAKNWQSVPDHPNSFRNKLTFEYTHKHIINVEDPMEIESFKLRMKQTNPYICRVLFYHQYHESIYHVYVDEIHLTPAATKPEVWRSHRIKIMESFAQLARTYGLMKVCRQMIGADSNGHPKVWIHPDPLSRKPWAPASNEAMMVAEIVSMLNSIQQKSGGKRPMNKSIMNNYTRLEYLTFEEYIRNQSELLANEAASRKNNRNSTFIESKISMNGSIDGGRKKPPERYNFNPNKTLPGPDSMSSYREPHAEPRMSNITDYSNYITKNLRVEERGFYGSPTSKGSLMYRTFQGLSKQQEQPVVRSGNNLQLVYTPVQKYNHKKNISLDKNDIPASKNQSHQEGSMGRVDDSSKSAARRRDTENFKVGVKLDGSVSSYKIQNKSMGNHAEPPKFANNLTTTTQQAGKPTKTSPLHKLFAPYSPQAQSTLYASTNAFTPVRQDKNRTADNFLLHKGGQYSMEGSSLFGNKGYRKEGKSMNMPNFLNKSNTNFPNSPDVAQMPTQGQKLISTSKLQYKQIQSEREPNRKENPNILTPETARFPQIEPGPEDDEEQPRTRPRKSTVAILKQQLHNILDSAPESWVQELQPCSTYEDSTRALQSWGDAVEGQSQGRGQGTGFSSYLDEQVVDREEIDLIKEKVEEKKIRFAQLKLDARKILDDDF